MLALSLVIRTKASGQTTRLVVLGLDQFCLQLFKHEPHVIEMNGNWLQRVEEGFLILYVRSICNAQQWVQVVKFDGG